MAAIPSSALSGSTSQSLVADSRNTLALQAKAARDPKSAIAQTAKQFESIFMQEIMKSMRNSTLASGMLENGGTQLGTEMLDQQYANQMTGLPGGLSAMIAKQLERQMGVAAGDATLNAPLSALPARVPGRSMSGTVSALPAAPAAAAAAAGAPSSANRTAGTQSTGATRQAQFVQQHTEAARIAEQHTGIPAEFMVAQAAHESGWGRREIRNADGSSAHNLFGIKAGPGWTGKTATVTTTEYVNGQAVKTQAKFRAYDSYGASFADYAAMMKTSPRYAKVVAHADTAQDFAKGLQRAGYATDPAYADKLTRVINTTLRLQRTLT
ncbi:MAG: hypothetical protein RJA98_3944 [Pseudomonadota bacterium]|jgi:flagellar protein FlgJ